MTTLNFEERRHIRRLAEDAISAFNPQHRPFLEAVARPTSIIALLDLADRAVAAGLDVTPAQDMVLVTKKDADCFTKIVAALGLEEAEDADVLQELLRLRATDMDMLDFVTKLQAWHADRVSHTRAVQNAVKAGTKVQCGSGETPQKTVELDGREAVIFKLGMEAGLASFEKLPFTVSSAEAANDEEDDDGE